MEGSLGAGLATLRTSMRVNLRWLETMTESKPIIAQKLALRLAACLLVSLLATAARAQQGTLGAGGGSDMRFFQPVDFDFDNQPIRKEGGFFFRYDKLSWAFTGERVVLGQRGLVYPSEQVWRLNPGDQPVTPGAPPLPGPYDIINGVQSAPPDADFAWGERYELGRFDGSTGWSVGILDGPEAVSVATYGFGTGRLPVSGDDLGGEGGEAAGANYGGGFGSVHVNFAVPAGSGFFLGWQDYKVEEEGVPNTVSSGPMVRISNPEDAFIEVDTVFIDPFTGLVVATSEFIPNPNVNPATGTKLADGIVDDVDGDGTAGFNPETGDVDFGDLYFFNIRFDTLTVRNISETQGIEIMHTYRLTNGHKMAKHQGNNLDIAYGVRFLRLRDSFSFDGQGSLLGRTFADTRAENQIVGPQIRAKWNSQRGRWNLGLDGRFLFGYNVQDLYQEGGIGEELVPGGLNSSLILQPTYFATGRQENDFSPVAELRADLSYQLTGSIAARLGYTATIVDNITRASQMVNWSLPEMGLLPGSGNQEIFINGVNFGFDVVY